MKFVLPLLLSLTTDVLAQPLPTPGSLTNPPGCPVITCVMFCTDGLQKDEKGCDKCSCVRGTGKLATGTSSCKRDADGCCFELGYAKCPEQGICLSTSANAIVPCKSWGNNPPVTPAATLPPAFSSGAGLAAPLTKPALASVRPLPATQAIPLTLTGANFQQTSAVTFQTPAVTPVVTPVTVGGKVGAAAPSGCSEVMCAMYCPNGYQKDPRGCNMCACASLTLGGVCAPVDCGGNTCAGGFEKNNQGCPTCICLSGSFPTLPVSSPPKLPPTSPTVSAPCKPNPCPANQKCVPEPKQCFKAPCPQYRCSASGASSTLNGKKGKKGKVRP